MTLDDTSLPLSPSEGEPAATPQRAAASTDISVPQDLRVPWTWLDLFLLALLALVGSTLFKLLLLGAFGKFGIGAVQIQKTPALFGLFALLQQVLIVIALMGYLALQLRLNFRVPFWRTIGWRSLEPGAIPAFVRALGLVVCGFVIALSVETLTLLFRNKAVKLPIQALYQDRRVVLALALMSVLVAPLFEETIFRGYIYPVVARSYGVAVGILGTGILFGLMHAPQLWGGWLQIGELVAVGIIFTCARAFTRTVLASFLLHVSYNFLVSFGLFLFSPWFRFISTKH
jgi:membrane protease YdiL (CAAX protease family)